MPRKHGSKEQKKAQKRKKKRQKRQYTANNERKHAKNRLLAAQIAQAEHNLSFRESRSEATAEQKNAMNDINKLTSIQHKRHNSVSAASLFEHNRNLITDEQSGDKEG